MFTHHRNAAAANLGSVGDWVTRRLLRLYPRWGREKKTQPGVCESLLPGRLAVRNILIRQIDARWQHTVNSTPPNITITTTTPRVPPSATHKLNPPPPPLALTFTRTLPLTLQRGRGGGALKKTHTNSNSYPHEPPRAEVCCVSGECTGERAQVREHR